MKPPSMRLSGGVRFPPAGVPLYRRADIAWPGGATGPGPGGERPGPDKRSPRTEVPVRGLRCLEGAVPGLPDVAEHAHEADHAPRHRDDRPRLSAQEQTDHDRSGAYGHESHVGAAVEPPILGGFERSALRGP
jgi:hypothetical protein